MSVQQMQLFAGLEPNRLSRGDRDLGSSPWIAANAGFSRLDGKDAETAKFNAVSCDECLFHAFEDSVHRSLCFCTWQAGALNNPLYKILLYHSGPPSFGL